MKLIAAPRQVACRAAVIPVDFAVSTPLALVEPSLAWMLWFLAWPGRSRPT